MAGFGDSGFAITPFGSGTPLALVAPPTKPPEHAAFIDPVTRDYVLDIEGAAARMPEVRQQMVLAVTTLIGSSSVEPQRGIRQPEKIDENIDRAMLEAVTAATAHVIRAKRATLDAVTTEVVSMGRLRTTISYTDLISGTPGQIIVGPQGSGSGVSQGNVQVNQSTGNIQVDTGDGRLVVDL